MSYLQLPHHRNWIYVCVSVCLCVCALACVSAVGLISFRPLPSINTMLTLWPQTTPLPPRSDAARMCGYCCFPPTLLISMHSDALLGFFCCCCFVVFYANTIYSLTKSRWWFMWHLRFIVIMFKASRKVFYEYEGNVREIFFPPKLLVHKWKDAEKKEKKKNKPMYWIISSVWVHIQLWVFDASPGGLGRIHRARWNCFRLSPKSLRNGPNWTW